MRPLADQRAHLPILGISQYVGKSAAVKHPPNSRPKAALAMNTRECAARTVNYRAQVEPDAQRRPPVIAIGHPRRVRISCERPDVRAGQFESGAPEGIRTPGLCLRRAALYP